jgi:uncharacterized protein (TIGR00251 family)
LTSDPPGLDVARTEEGVAFWIHVTPRARRVSIGGCRGDALRVSVREPPLDGRANQACADALAEALGLRRSAVSLDPGARGRRKRVRVQGDGPDLERRLRALAGSGRVA